MRTAEEMLDDNKFDYHGTGESVINYHYAKEKMIEFAKMHVEAALQYAADNVGTKTISVYNGGLDPNKSSMYDDLEEVDTDSILNAYPLENIK